MTLYEQFKSATGMDAILPKHLGYGYAEEYVQWLEKRIAELEGENEELQERINDMNTKIRDYEKDLW